MISLNSNPESALKTLIAAKATTTTIYVNDETPTADLPDAFIEIVRNGPVSSIGSRMGVGECVLMVIINVANLTTGASNTVKMNLILDQFQSIFSSAVAGSGYSFSLDKKKMVYQGRSLISGYSTKIINVITKF